MPSGNQQFDKWRAEQRHALKWTRRRDIPLAILAWIALGLVTLWAAGFVIRSLLVLAIAALLAYALAPAVKFFQRGMPRPIAIGVVYLFALSGLGLLLYLIINTAIGQFISLAENVKVLWTPGAENSQIASLESTLRGLGFSQQQIVGARQQIILQTQGFASSLVPLLTSVFNFMLDIIVVAVLSIYFLSGGARITRWLRMSIPAGPREKVNFLLDTVERVIGGYIRGQLFLSTLIGALVGIGMEILNVPYAVLLGVLAFILEFIPILGTLVSGAICVLLGLTQGWLTALLVLAYFVVVHILEGDIIGPRVVGKAIGIHPMVSLIAVVTGAELFGIVGALFASPIAGVIQAVLVAIWAEWRKTHPDQFPLRRKVAEEIGEHVEEEPENLKTSVKD